MKVKIRHAANKRADLVLFFFFLAKAVRGCDFFFNFSSNAFRSVEIP